MTYDQILEFLAHTGYAAIFFFILIALLYDMFVLYDEGTWAIYAHNADMGWLCLLLIPLEACVAFAFFAVVIPYVF
jgi:hypothetical protein